MGNSERKPAATLTTAEEIYLVFMRQQWCFAGEGSETAHKAGIAGVEVSLHAQQLWNWLKNFFFLSLSVHSLVFWSRREMEKHFLNIFSSLVGRRRRSKRRQRDN